MSAQAAERALVVIICCLCATALVAGAALEVRNLARKLRTATARERVVDLGTADEDTAMRMVNPTREEKARRKARMPARHPEQLLAPLRDAEESWLAEVDAQLWPKDTQQEGQA